MEYDYSEIKQESSSSSLLKNCLKDFSDQQNEKLIENWNDISWTCYYCNHISNEYSTLKSHQESLHHITNTENIFYTCSNCNQSILGYISFLNHVRNVHHKSLQLCCDVCNQFFPDYKQLSVHRDEHIEIFHIFPAVYYCTLCGIAQSTEEDLKNHILLSHNLISLMESDDRETEHLKKNDNGEMSLSPAQFRDNESFHVSIECKDEYHETAQIFQCGKCIKSFFNESDLEIHMRIHTDERSFVCEICSENFSRKSYYKIHMRKHTYICEVCSKVFSRKSYYKIHMSTHSKERPFKCEYCEMDFKKIEDYKSHMLVHSDNHPYQCEFCEKSFKRKASKTAHLRTHTGGRELKCDKCMRIFSTNLKNHESTNASERPFECEVCQKTCATPKILQVDEVNDTLESSASDESLNGKNLKTIYIHFSKEELDSLIENRIYKRNEPGRKNTRVVKILKPGYWQTKLTEKLWDEHHIRCGFMYDRGVISSGNLSITGKCKLGSTIECKAENLEEEIIKVACTINTLCNDQCKSRPCRSNERNDLGKLMWESGENASRIYKDLAHKSMHVGDKMPPQVYSLPVLRKIKSEFTLSTYLHKDVLTALCILESNILKNSIHEIGAFPFYVNFSSTKQLQVFNSYCQANYEESRIIVNATGRLVKTVVRPGGSISGKIFFYACVIHTGSNQIGVYQMLSERHDSNHISNWLRYWKRLGACPPKEFVSVDNKSLLIAGINAFTKYETIPEYVNACFEGESIPCFVRIDNAHFIKKYAKFLKNAQPVVKKFFLDAIGQLMLSSSLAEAKEILRSILLTSQSIYSGKFKNRQTECAKSISFLEKLAIDRSNEMSKFNLNNDEESFEGFSRVERGKEVTPNERFVSDDECGNGKSCKNLFLQWAEEINSDVLLSIEKSSDDEPNPFFFPSLASNIISDCREFPMWSCVSRDHLGYGRIPAFTAPVESYFNEIKTRLLEKKIRIRADEFIKVYLDYINGGTKNVVGTNKVCNELSKTHENACMKCNNDDLPTGAHKCLICSKDVHTLEPCSFPCADEVEGYKQKRICANCQQRTDDEI